MLLDCNAPQVVCSWFCASERSVSAHDWEHTVPSHELRLSLNDPFPPDGPVTTNSEKVGRARHVPTAVEVRLTMVIRQDIESTPALWSVWRKATSELADEFEVEDDVPAGAAADAAVDGAEEPNIPAEVGCEERRIDKTYTQGRE